MNLIPQNQGYSGRSSFDLGRNSKSRFFTPQIKDFNPRATEDHKSAFEQREEI